jgi:hypothetical protein
MASLVYDLPIAGFDARPFERAAEYASSGDFGQFSVRLTEDELLGEFGVVPQSIRVVIRVGNDIPPAGAWVNSPYRPYSSFQNEDPETS